MVSCNTQVEEKNNRIHEILADLGSDESFFKPRWLDAEQPEEVFNVRHQPTYLPTNQPSRPGERKVKATNIYTGRF